MEKARRLLRAQGTGRVLVVLDGDVDGLAAGVLAMRTVERLGGAPEVLQPGKGEHVHSDRIRARIAEIAPDLLLVVDLGSRAEPIVPQVPTVIVDHHQPRGFPPGAIPVSAFGHDPVASSSWLAFELFRTCVALEDLDWVAALGVVADLGPDADLSEARRVLGRFTRKDVSEAVALLNAPRRTGVHDVRTAFEVLAGARSPSAIARGTSQGVELLRLARRTVSAEVARCARTAPRISGVFALIPFASGEKVHPLVARRWMGRLSDKVVIAANYGYLPGRVNFAMRSARKENLIELLRRYPLPPDSDSGYGHPGATGGSLSFRDFDRLISAMGFDPEAISVSISSRGGDTQPHA